MNYEQERAARERRTVRNWIIAGVGSFFGLVALLTVFGSFYTVDQGERAVVLRMGAVVGESGPGLHFKFPWVNTIHTVSVQTHRRIYDKMPIYSNDQQTAEARISINFQATDPTAIYSNFGGLDNATTRLIDPKVYEQVKNVFGQFTAVTAIQERARLNAAITDAVSSAVATQKGPILITSVQVENVDFSTAYEQSVEQRMLAQVQIAQREQNLKTTEVEAQIATTKAEGEARAIKLRGEAEAAAIKARADALRANADLVQLQAVEKWDGKLPTQMIPGSTLPFINLAKQQ